DPQGAAEAGQRAEALIPGDYDLLFNLGMVLADSDAPARAIPYLQRFAREAPPDRYAPDIVRVRATLRRLEQRTPRKDRDSAFGRLRAAGASDGSARARSPAAEWRRSIRDSRRSTGCCCHEPRLRSSFWPHARRAATSPARPRCHRSRLARFEAPTFCSSPS